jgi:hypothetical protein
MQRFIVAKDGQSRTFFVIRLSTTKESAGQRLAWMSVLSAFVILLNTYEREKQCRKSKHLRSIPRVGIRTCFTRKHEILRAYKPIHDSYIVSRSSLCPKIGATQRCMQRLLLENLRAKEGFILLIRQEESLGILRGILILFLSIEASYYSSAFQYSKAGQCEKQAVLLYKCL